MRVSVLVQNTQESLPISRRTPHYANKVVITETQLTLQEENDQEKICEEEPMQVEESGEERGV